MHAIKQVWISLYTLHFTHYYAMPSAICAISKSTRLSNNNNNNIFVVLFCAAVCVMNGSTYFFFFKWNVFWKLKRKMRTLNHMQCYTQICIKQHAVFFFSYIFCSFFFFCLFVDNNQYKKREFIFRKAEEIFVLISFVTKKYKNIIEKK